MTEQNPNLTAYLAHVEREKVRAYAAATMTWKCPKPSEQAKQEKPDA